MVVCGCDDWHVVWVCVGMHGWVFFLGVWCVCWSMVVWVEMVVMSVYG